MNKEHINLLYELVGEEATKLKSAVRVCTNNLKQLMNIRIYNELLFPIGGLKKIENADINKIAKYLLESDMLEILTKAHTAKKFKFRVEVRGDKDISKKLAMECERISKGCLVNSISDYDVEIRLVRTKEGHYLPFLKMYTLPDYRFNYRINHVAASIHPVNAALMMKLCEPYMKEGARVIDPFCGVGTLLIERNKICKADTLYGIDIFEQAIIKARENAGVTKLPIHFINRDFFSFTHEHKFDEIVTNMPVLKDEKAENEIYAGFFKKLNGIMNTGMIFVYSSNYKCLRANMGAEYELVKHFVMDKKEETGVFVIRKK